MDAELDRVRPGSRGAVAERSRGHRQDHAHPPPPGRPRRRPRAAGRAATRPRPGSLTAWSGQLVADVPHRFLGPLLARGPPDADPLAVGAELLAVLGELEAAGPVVLVLDDAQWMDDASARALVFVGPTAAARPGPRRAGHPRRHLPAGWERAATSTSCRIRLGGLRGRGDRRAGRDRGRRPALCPPQAGRRLRDHTDGHPLHVRSLLAELSRPTRWPTRPGSCPRPARSPRSCWCASPSCAAVGAGPRAGRGRARHPRRARRRGRARRRARPPRRPGRGGQGGPAHRGAERHRPRRRLRPRAGPGRRVRRPVARPPARAAPRRGREARRRCRAATPDRRRRRAGPRARRRAQRRAAAPSSTASGGDRPPTGSWRPRSCPTCLPSDRARGSPPPSAR